MLETNNEQEEFTLSKETERRLADIKSALNAVREEHISTEEELSEKINELGKQISRLKRKIKVNDEIKEKMLPIADLVAVIGVEEVSEERIKTIKRELLKYDITTDDEIENFKMRFKECKRLETEFPGRLQRMSERYTKLKKAAHQLELAKDRDYCYGLKKEYESYEIMR